MKKIVLINSLNTANKSDIVMYADVSDNIYAGYSHG